MKPPVQDCRTVAAGLRHEPMHDDGENQLLGVSLEVDACQSGVAGSTDEPNCHVVGHLSDSGWEVFGRRYEVP